MSDLPELPPGFKLDQPPPPPGYTLDVPRSASPPVNANATALGGADMDEYFSQGSVGKILDAFGQGAKDAWGTEPLGISKETEAELRKAGIFKDYTEGHATLAQSFNEQLIRGSAAAADAVLRAGGAAVRGVSEVMHTVGGVPADLTPEALWEAFPAGHATGFPASVPHEVARAADLGVIGKGEAGWLGTPEAAAEARQALAPTGSETPTERVAPSTAPGVETTPAEAPQAPVPDIHSVAREIAPDTFAEYDALSAQKDTFRGHLNELADARRQDPQAVALQSRIDDILGKVNGVESRLTNAALGRLYTARDSLDSFLRTDTPDMALVRRDLQKTDFAMRDLAPDVSAAYRQAQDRMPETQAAEPAVQPVEPPVSETTPEVAPEQTAPQAPPAAAEAAPPVEQPASVEPSVTPAAATTEPPRPAAAPIEVGIAGDVSRQMIAAGRPAEEANAAAALVDAHYEARAARFDGAKGTAEDLYRAEAPTVRAGRGVQPAAMEMAQPAAELEQARRGKIRLQTANARAEVTLFKDADASTFIHETGHHWLEELMSDAADERAPPDLKADAATVHQWLGTEPGTEIPRRAHEKFARGFERYMMEGTAPTQALANVFAKFRDWLTTIYQTVAKLRAPINDDIRGVFDRMLATKDEPVIAPERPTGTFADLHEADALNTESSMAGEIAPVVRAERDNIMEAAHPEIQDERVSGRAPPADGGGAAGGDIPGRGVTPRGDNAGPEGGVSERGAVGTGRGNASPEGNRASVGGGRANTPQPTEPNARFGPADERLIDRAGNIRLDKLNQPADFDEALKAVADRNGGFEAERRLGLSNGEVLELAELTGRNPAFIEGKKLGDAFNAEQIVAIKQMLVAQETVVRDAGVAAAGGDSAAMITFAREVSRFEMIAGKVAQATAEWSHAGRALQMVMEGAERARDLNQFLRDTSGRTLDQMRDIAKYVGRLNTPHDVASFLNDTGAGKIKRAIVWYWINTLISGPVTHARYAIGNAVTTLWTPLVLIPTQATIDLARTGVGRSPEERVYYGEAGAQLYAIGKGSRDGFYAGIEAFRANRSPPLPAERIPAQFGGQTGPGQINPISAAFPRVPEVVGEAIGVPGRSVAAIHSFFKSLRYEMEIAGRAYRNAATEGHVGDAFDARVAELTAHPTDTMMAQATSTALRELYMRPTEYHSWEAKLIRLTNDQSNIGIASKIIVPFAKVGAEMTRNAFIDASPLGLANAAVRGNLLAGRNMQAARITAGTALMGTLVLATFEGMATGDGPLDPKKRAVWLLSHRPNHITIGPISIPYQGLGALGMQMRFAANMTETAQSWDENDGLHLAASFLRGLTSAVLDENWMRGLHDAMDAMYNPIEHGPQFLKNFVTSWLPYSVGMGQIAREVDPEMRQTQTIFDTAMAKGPLLSELLQPRRDMFGEPIPQGPFGAGNRYANDRVVQAMDALQMGVAPIEKKIRGVQLTEQQYDDYSRIGGRLAKMELDAMVGPALRMLPPVTQIDLIHKTFAHAREAAAAQIMMQSIGGANDIMKKATDAKAAAVHGVSPTGIKEILKAH